jgi:3-phosphoshikimate 1-carboxyvinyltransferase
MTHQAAIPIIVISATKALTGELRVIGDKSVSFRALFFSLMTSGYVKINGLNDGNDIKKTINAFQELSVECEINNRFCTIYGTQAILENRFHVIPNLDLGGSATSARFMLGLLSTQNFISSIHGNESLNKRPMVRLTNLLSNIGANIDLSNNCLPAIIKPSKIKASDIKIKYPSAQVQTSMILALLNTDGESSISYSPFIRDHSVKIMQNFGFKIELTEDSESNKLLRFSGKKEVVSNLEYQIFGDPSMAAYFVVAAILVPDSDLLIKDIYIQPNRIGYLEVLKNMGADIEILNIRNIHNEEIGDIRIRHSQLEGVEIPADMAPTMIDEYPILSVAASFAKGKTIMHGLSELKTKESNRMLSISQALGKVGIHFDLTYDSITIFGTDEVPEGGTSINSFSDHRIVMSFAIFALMTRKPVTISDISSISATFPQFFDLLNMMQKCEF